MKESEGSQFIPDLGEESTNPPKRIQHFHLVFYRLGIVFEHFFSPLKGKALFFNQMINGANVVNILFRELAIAFAVFLWLNDIKL